MGIDVGGAKGILIGSPEGETEGKAEGLLTLASSINLVAEQFNYCYQAFLAGPRSSPATGRGVEEFGVLSIASPEEAAAAAAATTVAADRAAVG